MVFTTTLQPFYNAAEAYTPMPEPTLAATAAAGQLTPGFTASFGKTLSSEILKLVLTISRLPSPLHGRPNIRLPRLLLPRERHLCPPPARRRNRLLTTHSSSIHRK